jgi:hypothetical protein
MEQLPTEGEINAATGLIASLITLAGLIIRAIEKRRDKRKLKRAIRNGTESVYEPHEDIL